MESSTHQLEVAGCKSVRCCGGQQLCCSLHGPSSASCLQVLEHAVCDCERRSKQLLSDSLSAQQHEREVRQVLAAAREAQAAAERALQQQTQRLLAAERMRLSDLKVSRRAGSG